MQNEIEIIKYKHFGPWLSNLFLRDFFKKSNFTKVEYKTSKYKIYDIFICRTETFIFETPSKIEKNSQISQIIQCF